MLGQVADTRQEKHALYVWISAKWAGTHFGTCWHVTLGAIGRRLVSQPGCFASAALQSKRGISAYQTLRNCPVCILGTGSTDMTLCRDTHTSKIRGSYEHGYMKRRVHVQSVLWN